MTDVFYFSPDIYIYIYHIEQTPNIPSLILKISLKASEININ